MKRFSPITAALALAVLAGMLFALSASAQEARDAAERHRDRKELRSDKAKIAYDAAALDRLSDLILKWNTLRKSDGREQETALAMDRITEALRSDLAETAVENAQAGAEIERSAREVRGDCREIRHDRSELREAVQDTTPEDVATAKRKLGHDRLDLRDDRRDRHDDARDQRKIEKLLNDKREIAGKLVDLQRQIDAAARPTKSLQNKQAALLHKYVALSQNEIKMGVREIGGGGDPRRPPGAPGDRRETRRDIR